MVLDMRWQSRKGNGDRRELVDLCSPGLAIAEASQIGRRSVRFLQNGQWVHGVGTRDPTLRPQDVQRCLVQQLATELR